MCVNKIRKLDFERDNKKKKKKHAFPNNQAHDKPIGHGQDHQILGVM